MSSLLSADTCGCWLHSGLSQRSFRGSGRGAVPPVMPVGLPQPCQRGRRVPVSTCGRSPRAPARLGVGAAALQGENPFSESCTVSRSPAGAVAPLLLGSPAPGAGVLLRELPEHWCVPWGYRPLPREVSCVPARSLPRHRDRQWWGLRCPGAGWSPHVPTLKPAWAASGCRNTV